MASSSASAIAHDHLSFMFAGLGKAAFGGVRWHRGLQGRLRCIPDLMDLRCFSAMDSITIFEASHLGPTPGESSSYHANSSSSKVSLINY